MLNHFDKNLTLSEWASLTGDSLSTFNRKFKKEHKISPKRWVLEQNMQRAHQKMIEGSSVSACANELSYANSSNFIKAYKSIYNKTPKQNIMT